MSIQTRSDSIFGNAIAKNSFIGGNYASSGTASQVILHNPSGSNKVLEISRIDINSTATSGVALALFHGGTLPGSGLTLRNTSSNAFIGGVSPIADIYESHQTGEIGTQFYYLDNVNGFGPPPFSIVFDDKLYLPENRFVAVSGFNGSEISANFFWRELDVI